MACTMDKRQRDRLNAEWAFLNATREMMNIARRQSDLTTYRQALRFGEAIAPGILGKETRILHGAQESEEAIYYREKATAETARQMREVTALELIDKDIAELGRRA